MPKVISQCHHGDIFIVGTPPLDPATPMLIPRLQAIDTLRASAFVVERVNPNGGILAKLLCPPLDELPKGPCFDGKEGDLWDFGQYGPNGEEGSLLVTTESGKKLLLDGMALWKQKQGEPSQATADLGLCPDKAGTFIEGKAWDMNGVEHSCSHKKELFDRMKKNAFLFRLWTGRLQQRYLVDLQVDWTKIDREIKSTVANQATSVHRMAVVNDGSQFPSLHPLRNLLQCPVLKGGQAEDSKFRRALWGDYQYLDLQHLSLLDFVPESSLASLQWTKEESHQANRQVLAMALNHWETFMSALFTPAFNGTTTQLANSLRIDISWVSMLDDRNALVQLETLLYHFTQEVREERKSRYFPDQPLHTPENCAELFQRYCDRLVGMIRGEIPLDFDKRPHTGFYQEEDGGQAYVSWPSALGTTTRSPPVRKVDHPAPANGGGPVPKRIRGTPKDPRGKRATSTVAPSAGAAKVTPEVTPQVARKVCYAQLAYHLGVLKGDGVPYAECKFGSTCRMVHVSSADDPTLTVEEVERLRQVPFHKDRADPKFAAWIAAKTAAK